MLHTTFKLARKAGACKSRYRIFAESVGGIKEYGDNTLTPLTEVLRVCGLLDALWCLDYCTKEPSKTISIKLACDFAEHVLHIYEKVYPNDDRPRKAIETARLYADGKVTGSTATVVSAAESATWAAAESAAVSAESAVVSAVVSATWSATRSAWAAVWSAAWSAESTTGSVAWSAEEEWQKQRFIDYMEEEER